MLECNPRNVRTARRQLLQRLGPIPADVPTVERNSSFGESNRHKLASLGYGKGCRHCHHRSDRAQTWCPRHRVQFGQVPNLKRGPIASHRDEHVVLLGDVAQQNGPIVTAEAYRLPRSIEGMNHSLRVAYHHQIVPTGGGLNLSALQRLGHLTTVDAIPKVEKVKLTPLRIEQKKRGVIGRVSSFIFTDCEAENNLTSKIAMLAEI